MSARVEEVATTGHRAPARPVLMTGNDAFAWAARLARPKVVPVYPITPQTPVLEKLTEFQANGEFDAEIIAPESEHSVMAACIPDSLAGVRVFTDKTPFNEIHLPLLLMAFPEARLVLVKRDPRDVAVSMLANNLSHGFNCAFRIDDIVRHLAATEALLADYRRELGFAAHVLQYERFVADPEAETRRLLDYVGLPFEEACLRFHESRRYAPTPSYARVGEKVNDRSVGRWRHFAGPLEPHVATLGPALTAGGYLP